MAGGLTVSPDVLTAGSGRVKGLADSVSRASRNAFSALLGVADSCGSGQVHDAVNEFSATVMQRFMDAAAGCADTADRLASTAQSYQAADSELARQAQAAVAP